MAHKHVENIQTYLKKKKRLVTYIICGISAVFADYFTFLLLHYIAGLSIEVAAPIGLVVGLVVSFVMNRSLTFSDQVSKGVRRTTLQVALYAVLFLVNNIITVYSINLLITVGVSAAVGKLFVSALITLWNYALYKSIIFK